ncbi:MAG: DUF362 domain-containing protein [Verrucomicrobiota bacterium]|nr:DUF362 domain-containing protein [Verrucomicrobiota bacterium]
MTCIGFVSVASMPSAPNGLVWESPLGDDCLYYAQVEALIQTYESEVGQVLQPRNRKKVGLKINTRGRAGLSTPLNLIRALVNTLEARGYDRSSILIIDNSTYNLREAGVMPPLSQSEKAFEGCPILALDSKQFYDPDWFYDSPLPALIQDELQLMNMVKGTSQLMEGSLERKSFLPMPLIFEVDYWINLVVGSDDPSLGVDGALANATLWNVSNSRRFLVNQATASAAVAEIYAIPELEERLVLHFISLDRYQFIGGPFFNSIYTRSEPRIWMSSDPVALDRLIYERINAMRLLEGFPEIKPVPRQLAFAASLGIGENRLENIRIRHVPLLGDAELEDRMIQIKDPLK